MDTLRDKTAVITGADSGIGRALAFAFAARTPGNLPAAQKHWRIGYQISREPGGRTDD
ncbi:MAG TPA: hypothetical protein VE441_07625 [Mycobacterium sp.]|nr:hypothetical protein [Mycobacterium sp.]